MKTINAITAALALGLGTFSATAGDLQTQGRSGYRVAPEKGDRAVTVALYRERRAGKITAAEPDRERKDAVEAQGQAQGRAGYRHTAG